MSVDIERKVIYSHDKPALQLQGEKIALAEHVEIVQTDDIAHYPLEIHYTEFQGFKRHRGVTIYLSPEMVRAIKEAHVLVATTCTRPKHTESPCNGYPRPDCPGYKEWNGLP